MSRLVAACATVLLALALGAAPASADANPGQVELYQGSLQYTAKPSQANQVTLRLSSEQIVLRDAAATLRAGAGCHPGADAHEVRCTREDTAGSGYWGSNYRIDTGDLDDQVTVSVDASSNELSSSMAFGGTIVGGAGDDVLKGGAGGDSLVGGPGADVLKGGGGDYDAADYGDHAAGVTVTVGDGANDGNATDGTTTRDDVQADIEVVTGTAADDTLTGNGGRNTLYGASGADTLTGGAGDDSLYGGTAYYNWVGGWEEPSTSADGIDALDGGDGHDTLSGGLAADVFTGGDGQDTVAYSDHAPGQSGAGVTVTLDGVADDGDATDGGAKDNVKADIENVTGSYGDDTITGNADGNVLDGAGGKDDLRGGDGADLLIPGADGDADKADGQGGDDRLYASYGYGTSVAGDGADVVIGGAGQDKVDYSSRQKAVSVDLASANGANDGEAGEKDTVGDDVEHVIGGIGDDVLRGSAQNNSLHGGGAGNDVLRGNGGDDRLTGGYGYSWLGGLRGDGADDFDGGEGKDILEARDTAADAALVCGAGADAVFFDVPSQFDAQLVPDPAPNADCEGLNPPLEERAEGTGTVTTDADRAAIDKPEGQTDLPAYDDAAPGTDAFDVVETTVSNSTPVDRISISEQPLYQGGTSGYTRVGQPVSVSVLRTEHTDERTAQIQIVADASIVPVPATDLRVYTGNGTEVPLCDDAPAEADACLATAPAANDAGGRVFDLRARSGGGFDLGVPVTGRVNLTGSGQSSRTVSYVARPGVANDVRVRFGTSQVVVTDVAEAAITAGVGCRQETPTEVRCSRDESGYSFASYEVDAGDGDDTVRASVEGTSSSTPSSSVNGLLLGGAGDDVLTGGSGLDTIIGGAGADHVAGGGGSQDWAVYADHAQPVTVTVGAGDGDDGGAEDGAGDTVAEDIENVAGGAGADTITGSAQTNLLAGNGGADVLRGGDGADQLYGGRYWYWSGTVSQPQVVDAGDELQGDEGNDQLFSDDGGDILAGGEGFDLASYNDRGSEDGVTVTIGDGANDGNAVDGAGDDVRPDTEGVVGTRKADALTGDASANRLDGGLGDDVLRGGDGNDTLLSGAAYGAGSTTGDDDDELHGEAGNDTFLAQTRWTTVNGQSVQVPDGADVLHGGAGTDKADYTQRETKVTVTLDGQAGDGAAGENDRVNADVENVVGGRGDDVIVATGDVSNRLHGGPAGDDRLEGGAGDDRLFGGYGYSWYGSGAGDGKDTLLGGAGDDVVSARDGAVDTLDCGSQLDVALVDDGSDWGGTYDVTTACEAWNPQNLSTQVAPGGTVSTNEATATDPVGLAVTSPTGGDVTVAKTDVLSNPTVEGLDYLDLQVNITAPDASLSDPLVLRFVIHNAVVPAEGAGAIRVFRDGAEVDADCSQAASGHATENGCVSQRTVLGNGDVELTILTPHASAWNFGAASKMDGDAKYANTGRQEPTKPPTGGNGGNQGEQGGQAAPAPAPAPVATPAPAAATPAAPKAPAGDKVAPKLAAVTVPAKAKLRALLKGGVKSTFKCSEACTVDAQLLVDAKTAKRLKLKGGVVGKATARGKQGAKVTTTVKPSAAAKRALGKQRKLVLTLRLTVKDAAGNATTTTRKVTVSR